MRVERRRAFTLVEMMVIVAVITVQLAVLLAVSAKSKEDQRRSTCQVNLRRCAVAVQTYCGDWDSALPSSASSESPVHDYLTKRVTGPLPHGELPRSWAEALRSSIASLDAVMCPSDHPGTRASYWWKAAVDEAWRDPSIRATKDGDYAYLGNQVILYEHSGWHSGSAAGVKDGITINVAYMDAHVAQVTVVNGQPAYPSAADERTGASALRLGEPAYYNFDNNTGTRATGVADYIDPRRYSDSY